MTKEPELLNEAISANTDYFTTLRAGLRNQLLNLQSTLYRSKNKKFIRCLYSHYVFDDQKKKYEQIIKELKNLGEFIKTDDAYDLISGNTPIDGKYFHLSYDDGLGCLNKNAAPILVELEVPAIIFINSDLPDTTDIEIRSSWESATNYAKPLSILTWKELKHLSQNGFDIGSHTKTHKKLSDISSNSILLEQEIIGCKSKIEQELGLECKYFAWPYGVLPAVDKKSISVVKKAGFKACFGVYRYEIIPGVTNPFLIPRSHFEPQWPVKHIKYFSLGGMEKNKHLPNW